MGNLVLQYNVYPNRVEPYSLIREANSKRWSSHFYCKTSSLQMCQKGERGKNCESSHRTITTQVNSFM